MLERISISEPKYTELQQKTANEFHELYAMIQAGWPETKRQVPHSIREYWESREELAVLDGVIYRGMRIVVPPSMRPAMLALIHGTHLGIVKCKQRAREALYWPGMSAQIEDKVKDCTMKEHFSRHGIPAKLVTDCGVQYISKEFETFARSYNFEHILVSPRYPRANGEAETAVKTVKSLWRKNNDKNKALLEYRATPIQGINLSPSQLSMGRRLRTTLPIACGLLEPEAHNIKEIRARMKYGKEKLKY